MPYQKGDRSAVPSDPPRDPDDPGSFTVSRRAWFGQVAGVGASLGLVAAAGHDRLVPFLRDQRAVLPGLSTWYATSCRECPAGCGMIVRTREGRALKAEGNPDHPINAGRLCARGQASLQGLYDPDRLRSALRRLRASPPARDREPPPQGPEPASASWEAALAAIGERLATLRGSGRLAVISDLQSGTLPRLIRRWLELFGSDRYLVYEPLNYESVREANRLLFADPTVPVPALDRADFVLSFGADFLETWLSPVLFTRHFAEGRVPRDGTLVRYVHVGPRVSMTAANADDRVVVRPGDERFVALALLQVISAEGLARGQPVLPPSALSPYAPETIAEQLGISPDTLRRLARAFARAKAPVALAGDPLLAGRPQIEAAAAAGLLNVAVRSPALDFAVTHAVSQTAALSEVAGFVSDLAAGEVDALLVIAANPVFSLPPAVRFAEALESVDLVVSLTPYPDETARLADWVLPTHTPLESWGDYEPQAGVLNLMQPVMGPMYDTRTAGDTLLALARAAGLDPEREFGASSYQGVVAANWQTSEHPGSSDQTRDGALEQGGSWRSPLPVAPRPLPAASGLRFGHPERREAIRLHFYPSLALFDGRGANRRWLQELPDPITRIGWASWAEFSPQHAGTLGLRPGQVAALEQDGVRIEVAAVVYAGLAPGTLAVPLGQGHSGYGRYADGAGGNPFQLCPAEPPDAPLEVTVEALPRSATTPSVGGDPHQYGRGIARVVPVSQIGQERPEELDLPLPEGYTRQRDIYPAHRHTDYRWAMAVDLSRCTGCGACVTACYAENNVGVVGRKLFAEHRAMAWIRIDRYYDWSDRSTPVAFLPMLCQQCDAAPCEPVCPVFAASHNENGLNMQVYNRCVGTRYCENNCPYKVRRFNWHDYEWPEPLNWQANPEVTVRCRGVMEKCTFCIQRIREATVLARREERKIRDGEVVPACAQTCPAGAIVFGDLMDPGSRVARIVAHDRRAYQVLAEVNTKPAVFYLKRAVDDAVLA